MTNKHLTYLMASAIALFVIYLILLSGNQPKSEYRELVAIDTSLITQVEVYKDGSTVTLAKRDNSWYITNPTPEFPANSGFIVTMMKKLDDLRIESEITSNRGRWSEFELEDDNSSITGNGITIGKLELA